jgi:hypothetical protein
MVEFERMVKLDDDMLVYRPPINWTVLIRGFSLFLIFKNVAVPVVRSTKVGKILQ